MDEGSESNDCPKIMEYDIFPVYLYIIAQSLKQCKYLLNKT